MIKLDTSKERPASGYQNGQHQLQSSLIESSSGKQQKQQYYQLSSYNNTQTGSRGGNFALSPGSTTCTGKENLSKGHPQTSGFQQGNALQSNYHPLNTFLNTQNTNCQTSGNAAQAFIQQVQDKINQSKLKIKQQKSIGGNGGQSISQNYTANIDINTSGIHDNSSMMQNPNSVKATQQHVLNNSNLLTSGTYNNQLPYHHQKNSKSMTVSKNSFIANFNVQSPACNTNITNLNQSKESCDQSQLQPNIISLQAQISQSPSMHAIQKKAKLQINNQNTSINSSSHQQQSQNNQQFTQWPRAQTQVSSKREQEALKLNTSNPNRHINQQYLSASKLVEDQNNQLNLTSNLFNQEANKSSPKMHAKMQQDSLRFFDEVLEDFIQNNRFNNDNKQNYFNKFLMTINDLSKRSQINQKLNFSQQQQQPYTLQSTQNQQQQNLQFISSSHNTAESLFQNSTQSTNSHKFFENLKQILEFPIQSILQDSQTQRQEFEYKKSLIQSELDCERKERAGLDIKIDQLEQEKDKLQNLVTTMSKHNQINQQKSRNQSTNSHTNSHDTSHNNTSNYNYVNAQGFNLNQQEIQMILLENEKLKSISKKQRKQISTLLSKEEKFMKLLQNIRNHHGINVDEIYNDNVKTPDSLSPTYDNQNKYQQKTKDFISPDQNHLSQLQPWELSMDHNITSNVNKINKQQNIHSNSFYNAFIDQQQQNYINQLQQEQITQLQNYESDLQQNGLKIFDEDQDLSQISQSQQTQKQQMKVSQKNKKSKQVQQNPFYANSQHEYDMDDENQEGEESEQNDNHYIQSQEFYEDNEFDENQFSDDISNNTSSEYNGKNGSYSDGQNENFNKFSYNSTNKQNNSSQQMNLDTQQRLNFQKNQMKLPLEKLQNYGNQQDQYNNQQKPYQIQHSNQNQHKQNVGQQNNYQNIQFIPNNFQKQNQSYQSQNNTQSNVNNYIDQNKQNHIKDQQKFENNGSSHQIITGMNYYNDYNQSNDNQPKEAQLNSYGKYNQQSEGMVYNENDQLQSEQSVNDSESDVLSIPVNDIAYASYSTKMINAQMKNKLKINLGGLQVTDASNKNNLNLNKLQNGEEYINQPNNEEIFDYHDEFMNKFDEFSQSWRDAINQEKKRYQNDNTSTSKFYVSAL